MQAIFTETRVVMVMILFGVVIRVQAVTTSVVTWPPT